MNVQVPTSDRSPPEPSPPVRRPPKWLLLVVAAAVTLGAVVGAVGTFSASEDASPDPEGPTGQDVPPAREPARPMHEWELIYFPGAGTFVDVVDHPDATVALARTGTDLTPASVGSAVWSFDAADSSWHTVELEAAELAAVSSVAMVGGEVLIAGSVGESSPTSALWAGPATGPFRIVDQPFSQTGHLHAIRRLDTETVLLGRPIERRDGLLLPLGPPVVLVGEPGDWTDITPPDAEIVTEIISRDGEWIAVGGRAGEAMAWHSMDRGTSWSDRPPPLDGPSVLTDVAVVGAEAYAVALITDAGPPTQLLFRYIGSWSPAGEPWRRGISWIAGIGGELVGSAQFGPDAGEPQLWQHGDGGRWSAVRMAVPAAPERVGHTLFTAADGATVVGSVSGQPAMWRSGASGETVLAPTPADADRLWERVATLPADSQFVTFAGEDIVVVASGPQSPTTSSLLISRDGLEWEEQEFPTGLSLAVMGGPTGLSFAEIQEVSGNYVVVGIRTSTVVVGRIEADGFEVVAEFEGRLMALDSSDDSIIVFIRLLDATTRYVIPIGRDGPITETPVSGKPVAIWPLGEGVVVRGESGTFVWPPNGMSVSLDGGIDWTPVDVEPWAVFRIGGEIIVFTGETPARTFRLEVDPVGFEQITLPTRFTSSASLGLPMFEWADGLVIREEGTFEYLAAIDAEPVMLELSPRTGFNGVFAVPAAGGHVVTQEGEDRVLYRWTGRTP